MNRNQRAFLVKLLHETPLAQRDHLLNMEIQNFGLNDDEIAKGKVEALDFYNKGIGNLNPLQLKSIFRVINDNKFSKDLIIKKLILFEVDYMFHDNIIQFFEDYIQSNKPIEVEDLASDFKGVQVATNDDFNKILNRGWTGDWDLDPSNIIPFRIQIASMNNAGNFPRGYYINADILNTKEIIDKKGKIRHRVFIANPIIVNSGNRNVKFSQQPIRYFK